MNLDNLGRATRHRASTTGKVKISINKSHHYLFDSCFVSVEDTPAACQPPLDVELN